MEREIRFRAWDKEAERMIYSDSGDDEAIWQIDYTGIVVLTLQVVDSNPGGLGHVQENKYLPAEIILMQFAGLKDDNEVEIYEGDIVQMINGERLSVEWNDDILRWQFSDGSPLNDGDRYSSYKIVIGNIYQNPGLLTSSPL